MAALSLPLLLAAFAGFGAARGGGNDSKPSRIEAKFVGLLNEERLRTGMEPLEISPKLTAIADDYVRLNARRGGIDHDRDAPFTKRANRAGCTKWDGPVLARGYGGPAAVLEGWLDSPGHRRVLMDPENEFIGPGFVGEYALVYAMPCTGSRNRSGDFGAGIKR